MHFSEPGALLRDARPRLDVSDRRGLELVPSFHRAHGLPRRSLSFKFCQVTDILNTWPSLCIRRSQSEDSKP